MTDQRQQRRFDVSFNRGKARHKVRYVESGGDAVSNGECTLCTTNPAAGDTGCGVETANNPENQKAGTTAP
ncbi:MAG: hypothetical protein LAT63_09805 [Marinobacter sp.]|nr:hypothetical protein [Marinobacter sp.]